MTLILLPIFSCLDNNHRSFLTKSTQIYDGSALIEIVVIPIFISFPVNISEYNCQFLLFDVRCLYPWNMENITPGKYSYWTWSKPDETLVKGHPYHRICVQTEKINTKHPCANSTLKIDYRVKVTLLFFNAPKTRMKSLRFRRILTQKNVLLTNRRFGIGSTRPPFEQQKHFMIFLRGSNPQPKEYMSYCCTIGCAIANEDLANIIASYLWSFLIIWLSL